MIDERDVWRAAKLMIDQHGVEAPIEAALRADKMLDVGDLACRQDAGCWGPRRAGRLEGDPEGCT